MASFVLYGGYYDGCIVDCGADPECESLMLCVGQRLDPHPQHRYPALIRTTLLIDCYRRVDGVMRFSHQTERVL